MGSDRKFWGIYTFLVIELDGELRNLILAQKRSTKLYFHCRTKKYRFSDHFLKILTLYIPSAGRNFGPKIFSIVNMGHMTILTTKKKFGTPVGPL